jgi:hypothetical protein
LAGASSTGTVTQASSRSKEVYNPKAVIPHAASLRQASAHCAIFPTAASRRSLGRISVPVWPVALSGRLPVVALVGHHPTNKLIGRGPIPSRKTFHPTPCEARSYPVLDPVSQAYPRAEGRSPTCYSPVRRSCTPEEALPLDLHVLSTPPAFVLSQDQTLQQKLALQLRRGRGLDDLMFKLAQNQSMNKLDTLLSSQETPAHHFDPLGPGLGQLSYGTWSWARSQAPPGPHPSG